jgi:T-complex protein 1 subunit epsilon
MKDEQGRPFIVVREYARTISLKREPVTFQAFCILTFFDMSQGKKKRQHGTDAVKSHIVAAKTVANIVKTSLVRFSIIPSKLKSTTSI